MSLYKKIINEVAKVVKKEINEAFDFDSVNKLNKKLNAYDTILSILEKINNSDDITEDDYEILILFDGIYKVKDNEELKKIIKYFTFKFDNNCNLNWIDVSNITNMTDVFCWSEFNGDISKWDVSNVTNMMHMFKDSLFNGDISLWNVSNVTNMYGMFEFSVFNKDISKWDVSNVTDMETMFKHSKFNKDLSSWDVRKARRYEMFTNCPIKNEYRPNPYKNQKVNEAFDFDSVNKEKKPLNIFPKLRGLIKISYEKLTLDEKDFLISMKDSMPAYKVQNTKELRIIISHAIRLFGYNCDLNWIDVGDILQMDSLFIDSEFNGNISKWDVSKVVNMSWMFNNSKFNGDISKWDVSNVWNMEGMFIDSEFNRDISLWNVSNVENMYEMFCSSHFNKNISSWNIHPDCDTRHMFDNCYIKNEYKPSISINESFDFGSINKEKKSVNIFPQIRKLIKTPYKKLTLDEKDFLKSIKDSMPIVKPISRMELKAIISRSIKLFGTDCDLNWLDTSDITNMSNIFENTKFNGDISLWDTSKVTNMDHMFANSIFKGDISHWDVSNVTDMQYMFWSSEFNGDISGWDVSSVTDMSYMFAYSKFNNDISNWDVSNVTNMHYMFAISQFNGNISKWDVSKVTTMSQMFLGSAFTRNISKWDVSNVTTMHFMFHNTEFNHDISNWNINPACNTNYMFDDCSIIDEYKPKCIKK